MARGLVLRRTVFGLSLAGAAGLCAEDARAGGFEIPDLGSQALGRGAAFVAKADDPTAIYWNPAGLAKQRGTKLLLDTNVYLHSFSFRRIGHFNDDANNPDTPWGQAEYPQVNNTGGPYTTPFIALSTDFGYFDRVTFGAGVFQPSTIANRTFPLGVNNKPSSARYDYVQDRTAIYYPTLAAGFRATKWLDLGVSASLALAKFDQTGQMYADAGSTVCKNAEFFPCDTTTRLVATGTSFGATFGAMLRPTQTLQFGLSLRTPINITGQGVLTPSQPPALDSGTQAVAAGNATYAEQLPMMIKAGGRYIGMDQDFEIYDLELDLTFENWGTAQGQGPILQAPNLGTFQNIQTIIEHGYSNTFGLRAGGAYNIDTGDQSLFSIRGGAYFDSSATDFATTRVDVDTLTKIAGTLGFSYKYSGFTFDAGYAAVASVPRVVGQGQGKIAPLDALANGTSKDSTGAAYTAVNEGAYRGFTHIVSLGVTVSIDAFLGKPRPVKYGNPWEPNYAGPRDDEDKKPETKPEETKKPRAIETQRIDEKKPPVEEPKPEKKPPPPPPVETQKPEPKPDALTPDEERPVKKPPVKKPPPPPPDDVEEEEPKKPPVKKPPPPPPVEEEKPIVKPPPPPPPPVEVKPAPPPPPPPPPPKPPTKRKEWWEETE